MTPYDKIGQMMLLGWQVGDHEYKVNDHAISLIDELAVGGVVIEPRNITAPKQLSIMLEELQVRAASCGLPHLFIAVDQEGGAMSRLGPPLYAETRSAAQIGLTGDEREARCEAGRVGRELRQLGFNWNLAPVVDVLTDPGNTLIGERSYGSDPGLVSRLGAATIAGLQNDGGVMACAKHYPGHGDNDRLRHKDIWVTHASAEHLEAVELAPFRAAVEAGVASIMATYVYCLSMDGELPAALSPRMMTTVLRQEMGFDGLIVINCLEALVSSSREFSIYEAVRLALLAGADIISCCHDRQMQIDAFNAFVELVEAGIITEKRLDESNARIERAKRRWVDVR